MQILLEIIKKIMLCFFLSICYSHITDKRENQERGIYHEAPRTFKNTYHILPLKNRLCH